MAINSIIFSHYCCCIYNKRCNIWHLWDQRVPGYCDLPGVRTWCL